MREMAVERGQAASRLGLVVAAGDKAEDLLANVPELVQRASHDNARLGVERSGCAQVAQGFDEIDAGRGKGRAVRAVEAEASSPTRAMTIWRRRLRCGSRHRSILRCRRQQRNEQAVQGGQWHGGDGTSAECRWPIVVALARDEAAKSAAAAA